MIMLKHLKDILPRLTSHGVGEKRVLLSAGETETAVTQIAVTTLHAGETANGHSHATMEEYFFFLHGEAALTIDGERTVCHEGDFVQIRKGKFHTLEAVSEVEVMTIGIATEM